MGAEQIAHLLAEYLIYPLGMHLGVRLVRLYLCRFRIQSPDGRFSPAPDFRQKRTTVDYLGLSIPVVSLEFLLALYTQLKRPGRAALIEARLKALSGQ